jgi:crotonobetainyl-CoA:carnitine CoA-transferase CaiB-like acyl-CoA transferase
VEKSEFYAKARADLAGPLQGLVVLEATTTWAGPMAGCLLADLGALVIKVEHPEGEIARRIPPFVPGTGLSVFNETVNRNKKNVSLDLRLPEGRELFLRLCRDADIVIENFKPGTLAEWGVGYADVAAVKPDIVYVSISGFGQFGPLSPRPGYDPLAQNFSGWASLNGEPSGGPTKAPTFLGDDLAGLHGALAALAAILHRNRSGEGQHVDVALLDGLLFQSNGNLTLGALGLPLKRWGNEFSLAAPVNRYDCTDGQVYAGVLLDSHWQRLAAILGRPDLAGLRTLERLQRRDELDGLLGTWCAGLPTAEVLSTFTAAGLTATRVNTYAEAAGETQIAVRDMLQPTTLSDGTEAPITGPAAKFSRTPTRVRSAASALGGDNAEIYGGLGLDEAELVRLRDAGIV